jgi:lipopolysaccharide biosynthesis glycosyltransferase
MKYVYVLTSSDKDQYYEQFLLSVTSFRMYNPDACIIALVDEKTKQNLVGKRNAYEKMLSEIQVITPPAEFSQKEASRWIKTSIHHYVSGDFLFIDCDTIITEKINVDFQPETKIGAVLDTHATLDKHHLRDNFQKEDIKAGFCSSLKSNTRYNGGLIFCKDDTAAREFYEKWHTLWIESRNRGCSQDMPSLNQANYELGIITDLAGEWNCQISHNGLPYLHNAKIIHYYATSLVTQTSPFMLASDLLFKKIKETGAIPDEALELLKDPRSAFDSESRIIAGKDALDVVNSNFFAKLLWLRNKMPNLFNSLNKFSSLVKNTKKSPT